MRLQQKRTPTEAPILLGKMVPIDFHPFQLSCSAGLAIPVRVHA